MNILDQTLKELALPLPSRRVYLFLAEHGASSARLIAERLSLPRPSVYDHVGPLIEAGVVALLEQDGKMVFAVSGVDDLVRLVKEREQRVSTLAKTLLSERDTLIKNIESVEPKIKFYEGKDGLRQLLSDFLWSGAMEIVSVWPYHEMLRVLGEETLEEFNRKRIRQKISLRTVWTDRPKGKERIWKGGDFKVERRFAPRGFAPEMGYTLYGDKVAFIASHEELYGFIVHSKDFARLQKAQFELLWKESKEK
jgi:sugar-specific transcriptional regulator TrmB